MPSLKTLRTRITSVRATRKITQAMRMVAASKLRRAQDAAAAARAYADVLAAMLGDLVASAASSAPPAMTGRPEIATTMVVVAAADRGLCGGFNATILRRAKARASELKAMGRTPLFLAVGRKARDALMRLPDARLDDATRFASDANADNAQAIGAKVLAAFEAQEIGGCDIVYARFQSALVQVPTVVPLIPAGGSDTPNGEARNGNARNGAKSDAVYDYEPSPEEALDDLLTRNIATQILRALLENAASEQGARMTAMDSATRNAGDMIDRLTLEYNRARQAMITRELIEVISGADAL